jgi:6-phosphogluconolactonase
MENHAAGFFVFVGTYTQNIRFGTGAIVEGRGEGIYILAFDPAAGTLKHYRSVKDIANPSYLCLTADRRFVYAVNELKKYEGNDCGSVSAFELNQQDMSLRLLNKRPTRGTDPCHVCLDEAGKYIFVSNFMSGSLCTFPIHDDGRLGTDSQFIQHSGSSIDPIRQTGPHAHSLTLDRTNRFAFVPDLGIDKLAVYRYEAASGHLLPAPAADYKAQPGSGPRHFTFHPNGRFAYLIHELSSTITAFRYEEENGLLTQTQSVPTIRRTFNGDNTCADIHIAPSGKFLYGSNRGEDSIVIYRIDGLHGHLSYAGHEDCGGRTPRSFAIAPGGRFLFAANQDSDTIVTFRIDETTGCLSRTGCIDIPTPVCVKCVMM